MTFTKSGVGVALVQNLGETERDGFELAANYQVSEALRLYGNFSVVDAELVQNSSPGTPEASDFIPVNAVGIDTKPEIDILLGIKYAFE